MLAPDVFSATIVLSRVIVPAARIPPPPIPDELYATVELVTVIVPLSKIPPACSAIAG